MKAGTAIIIVVGVAVVGFVGYNIYKAVRGVTAPATGLTESVAGAGNALTGFAVGWGQMWAGLLGAIVPKTYAGGVQMTDAQAAAFQKQYGFSPAQIKDVSGQLQAPPVGITETQQQFEALGGTTAFSSLAKGQALTAAEQAYMSHLSANIQARSTAV